MKYFIIFYSLIFFILGANPEISGQSISKKPLPLVDLIYTPSARILEHSELTIGEIGLLVPIKNIGFYIDPKISFGYKQIQFSSHVLSYFLLGYNAELKIKFWENENNILSINNVLWGSFKNFNVGHYSINILFLNSLATKLVGHYSIGMHTNNGYKISKLQPELLTKAVKTGGTFDVGLEYTLYPSIKIIVQNQHDISDGYNYFGIGAYKDLGDFRVQVNILYLNVHNTNGFYMKIVSANWRL